VHVLLILNEVFFILKLVANRGFHL
jgi:hypothetical protein